MCHPFVPLQTPIISMIGLFSLFLLHWLLVDGAEVNPCGDSTWHYYNETGCCYKTTPNVSTWFDGTAMCARMHLGAQMASLHSEQESKWVAKVYKNGIDGIHAWTGLSQTKTANNWTYTDGSKPWSWFHAPFPFVHNHTSCVEIVDNWLVELVQNSGKTQPVFCYTLLNSLCKFCPAPPSRSVRAVEMTTIPHRLEKAHPKSNAVLEGCGKGSTASTLSSILIPKVTTPTVKSTITTIHKSVAGREFDFPKTTQTPKTATTTRKSQLEVNAHPTTKTTITVAPNLLIKKVKKGCDGEEVK